MILSENYVLSNGVTIPKLALGTWFINNKNVVEAVKEAIKLGYRHIDTAQAYRNEKGVGQAIRECGVPRSQLFVTTKIDAGVKSYDKAVKSIEGSLKTMGLDYIDLIIIHAPQPWTQFRGENRFFEENKAVWKAMEEAYKAGKVKAIGLSNFDEEDLANILESCTIKPMVNQILAHVSNTPMELIEYTQSQGILVEAYSPVGHGEVLKNAKVKAIADRYSVSIPQLCIRYDIQLGLLPLPKTANPAHMKNNAELDFEITDADMVLLKNMEKIEDYGDARMMPVYGGKMNLKSMFQMIWASIKG